MVTEKLSGIIEKEYRYCQQISLYQMQTPIMNQPNLILVTEEVERGAWGYCQ